MTLFYIIGAGPSYMDVTEEEWKYLEDKHTLTFTRVPYGSRKFEYYFSIERNYLDKSVLEYMEKLGYTDTKLILYLPESIVLAKKLGFNRIGWVNKQTFYFMPSRQPWFLDESKPPHKFIKCRAKSFMEPIFRFRGQLTATVNSALILGATEIRLIGVDLNNQKNFYQYEDILRKVCKDEKTVNDYLEFDRIKHELGVKEELNKYKEYNQDTMHSTNTPITDETKWGNRQLRGVADTLQWMDSELKEEGLSGIYITNKNSLLFKENKLEYKSIMGD